MWDQPTFDLYRQVHCPILIIVAEQEATNEQMRSMQQARNEGLARIQSLNSNATIIRMPNTIHDIPLQRPQELFETITQTSPVKEALGL
ncbi:MAG TPA: hypothetical protein DHW02_09775 [Ktedonobacter sp.]|nr:hypothetical protein [Ktedonobacter sp.]